MSDLTTFLPSYDANPGYNAEILRQSVPKMVKHNVAPHPINYAIWYEYISGTNGKLNKDVDEIINTNKAFDDATSLKLYTSHICNASVESFEKINADLQRLIDSASIKLKDTGDQVATAGDSFQNHSDHLASVDNISDVKTVLSGIVSETRHLADLSNNLKAQLGEANKEMDELRGELTKVKEMASTDALTGLLNRRAFDDELTKLMHDELVAEHVLAILDLDHFKKVNDTFGHIVGDKVIRYTASLLKKHVPAHHSVARYGGEEMAVIMPSTSLEEAVKIAEMIRESLAKSELKQKDNGQSIGKVTVSIGITLMKAGDTAESFIARADDALYEAKESGRNRVIQRV